MGRPAALDPRALGSIVYRRRLALRLSLLELNRHTGLSLLDLVQLERGRAPVPDNAALRRLAGAVQFADLPSLIEAARDAAGNDPRPAQTTGEAVERFLRRQRFLDAGR
jgi:transcriptional regulator with XRE-family HTH domain